MRRAAPIPVEMPEQFGKYLLLDRINQGGMAEVYLAKAFGFGGTDQLIAVKRIRREVSEDPTFVEMFVNEAKLAVMLNHANIARIFELGKTGAHYYIAMEYLAGRDLRALLNRANHNGIRLPEHLVLYIVASVLEGLDFAHRKQDLSGRDLNIVHRDVSPHNVIISYSGEVKLIDFGIAKAANNAANSQSGVLKGKYGYMAPEQVLGRAVDARTDIFSAGVLFYELLTQRRLFEGASDFSILEKVRYAEVYPPALIVPGIPPQVEDLVLRALNVDADHRYPTASDMHDAVVEVMLESYGQPTPRELANLMKSLFANELKRDLKLMEQARELVPPAPVAAAPDATAVGRPLRKAAATVEESPPPPTEPGLEGDGDTEPDFILDRQALEAHARAKAQREEAFVPAEITAPGVVPPTQAAVDQELREATVVTHHMVQPTRIVAARRHRTFGRDQIIILSALLLSLGLVLLSWFGTRDGARAPGQVTILSVPPGATVILDNVVVGRTPYQASALPAGKHTMILQRDGFETEARVIDVVPGEMLPVQLVLTPKEGD